MSKKLYEHICDQCGMVHYISSSTYHKLKDGRQKNCYCSIECKSITQQTGADIICDNCGKIVHRRQNWIDRQHNRGEHMFCCLKCQSEFKHKQSIKKRECEICGSIFEISKSSSQRFCSRACQGKWQSTQTGELNPRYNHKRVKCGYCGKDFMIRNYKVENQENYLCSKDCRVSWFRDVLSIQPEYIDKRRKIAVENLENGVYSKSDSAPQRIVDSILDKIGIDYIREYNAKYYSIDNYLTKSNLMIEVMGDYWHCNPTIYSEPKYEQQKKQIARDKAKHTYLLNKYGIEVLYLWESDLYNHSDVCEQMIKEYINSGGKLNVYHSFNYNKEINERIETKY